MSEFRLWIQGKIARLDGARERRFVALAAALIFASLALGPQALRVVDAAVNAPDIRIDELGANPLSNPVIFKATTLNVILNQVIFLVAMPDGSTLTLSGHRASTTDLTLWASGEFIGAPGQSYVVKARGFSSTATTPPVDSSQSVTFSIFNPAGASSPPPDEPANPALPGFVEIFQLVAWPGVQPKIEARGQYSGFASESAFFRVQSISGLAFLSDIEAERGEGTVWRAFFPVPGGSIYKVTLVARAADGNHESLPVNVTVLPAETPPPVAVPPSGTTTPPPSPPVVSLLLPLAGAEMPGPIQLTSRVTNASATAMVFEVLDPAGVTRSAQAAFGSAGEWTAMFTGEPGQYSVRARASLIGGNIILSADSRSFRILAAATGTTPPPTTGPIPPPTATATTTQTVPEPFIELFSPPADAAPFPGAVPISARVRNGLPEKVVAVVLGPNGGETVIIASKTATGDFWTALSEGPDGEYRFRVRALVGGKDVLSSERRFAVKRPLATTPPPTTATPPPATNSGTAATGALPPPPPSSGDASDLPTNVPIVTRPILKDFPIDMAAGSISLPEALRLECRNAGILPERCAEWLKAKYQSRECLDAGAFTREACTTLLGRLNIAPDESKLMGLAALSDITQAREDALKLGGEPVRRDKLPASIAALIPAQRDSAAFVRVFAVANATDESSPGLLVLDTDGDGLPDDVERRFGTDPAAADTDGDGFSDGMETKNGYNPLGPGALERPLRGVEKALIEGLALEEPRGSEAPADDAFTITAEGAPLGDGAEEDVIRLAGTAAPNTVVTIFVYSYLPVVVTTTTDANGNWTYDFGSKLAEGRHEAYVSVNDDTGKLVAASSPLAFFVKEAQAVTEEDFLRPDVNVEETPATLSRWFVYGGIGLVALALVLVVAIIRQVRKSPMTGSDEGV